MPAFFACVKMHTIGLHLCVKFFLFYQRDLCLELHHLILITLFISMLRIQWRLLRLNRFGVDGLSSKQELNPCMQFFGKQITW